MTLNEKTPLILPIGRRRFVFGSLRTRKECNNSGTAGATFARRTVTPPKSRCVPSGISSCGEILRSSNAVSGQLTSCDQTTFRFTYPIAVVWFWRKLYFCGS